jgi:hypothetical protein
LVEGFQQGKKGLARCLSKRLCCGQPVMHRFVDYQELGSGVGVMNKNRGAFGAAVLDVS